MHLYERHLESHTPSFSYQASVPADKQLGALPEETVDIRTRSVGHAVCRPYSDSEDSDNDVLYADEHDSALQRVNLRKEWSTQTPVDSCGDGCAQFDDFKWFLPTDVRVGDLSAPESEIETSDSESGVNFIEPNSTRLQTETTTQQLLRPPVVVQTRPMEGCHTAVSQRLRRCGGGGFQTSVHRFWIQ